MIHFAKKYIIKKRQETNIGSRNYFKDLQAALTMRKGGWSQNLCEVLRLI